MRTRLPWILLAVSLVLNLAFVAGAAWMHFHRPPPPDWGQRAERAGRDMKLEPPQKEAFDRFVRTQRENAETMREKNRPMLREVRREFVKPTPDDAAIDRLLAEVDANRRAVREQNSKALRDFMKTLSPEQRERFLALIEPPGGRRPPR
jgi:Spy/CpxP family protein refolding chaperone